MKDSYDFSKGKQGALLPVAPGKERITIRLDTDVLNYFRDQVEAAGGGNYQTSINAVLRDYMENKRSAPDLEATLRRVIREELQKALGARWPGRQTSRNAESPPSASRREYPQ